MKRNKISVAEYLSAIEKMSDLIPGSDECLKYKKICDLYQKQNKYNIFVSFNVMYPSYIKYGKITLFSVKMLILFIPTVLLSLFLLFFNIKIFSIIYIITNFGVIFFTITYEFYRKKFKKYKEIYEYEKKNPNWKRKQILKKIIEN